MLSSIDTNYDTKISLETVMVFAPKFVVGAYMVIN